MYLTDKQLRAMANIVRSGVLDGIDEHTSVNAVFGRLEAGRKAKKISLDDEMAVKSSAMLLGVAVRTVIMSVENRVGRWLDKEMGNR